MTEEIETDYGIIPAKVEDKKFEKLKPLAQMVHIQDLQYEKNRLIKVTREMQSRIRSLGQEIPNKIMEMPLK